MDFKTIILNTDSFNFNETFDLYSSCSKLIISNEEKGINLLIYILDNINKFDEKLHSFLADLVESVGFYPYLEKEHLKNQSTASNIRKYSAKSKYLRSTYFHDEQKYLLDILDSGKNLVVSAPTSFGKSLLIEEIIASKKHNNIVIIQPTLALLDETRKKLTKYEDFYNLIIRTSQAYSEEKGNIFLLTAERVNEYPSFPHIDFLIVDEFYKFSAKRDDERSFSLNIAFYKLWNSYSPRFYLLGPNIQGITSNFEEHFNAKFYQTNYKLVFCSEQNILTKKGNPYVGKIKKEKLFQLLLTKKDEQSLIYCSSPAKARKLAYEFYNYLSQYPETNPEPQYLPLVEWINVYIDPEWNLADCLKKQIAFHDGILPKHISTSIIDYFNRGKISFLFCTTTIIEGVNTSAKNIMYFDATKGKSTPIDFFDYSNIKGRAGRLMHHYIGNIYHFNVPPEKAETVIDIPFFEQNPIQDEVLIQLDKNDVKDRKSTQYLMLEEIPNNDKEVIIKNSINIKGQVSILEELRKYILKDPSLVLWTGLPNYDQLKFCMQLAWDNLLIDSETTNPMTKESIVYHTNLFRKKEKPSLTQRITKQFEYRKNNDQNKTKKNDYEYKNLAILDVFRVQKHWIEYKIPKWLSVMHNLQEYIAIENGKSPGNYLYFANILENDFLPEEFMLLLEYGIPNSAIDKLRTTLDGRDYTSKEIVDYIKKNSFYNNSSLLTYEKEKIKNAFSID